MGSKIYYMVEDCPQCGQQDEPYKWLGARMSNTAWGHDFSCCSEECGLAFFHNPKRLDMLIQRAEFESAGANMKLQELKRQKEDLLKNDLSKA